MNVKKTTFNALFVIGLTAGAVFSNNAMQLTLKAPKTRDRANSAPETPTKGVPTRQDGQWTPYAINIYNNAELGQKNRQQGDIKHTNTVLGKMVNKSESKLPIDTTETTLPKFSLDNCENIFPFEVSHAPFQINQRILTEEKERQEKAAHKAAAKTKRNERKLQKQLESNEEIAQVLADKKAFFAECDEFQLIVQSRTNQKANFSIAPTAPVLSPVDAPMITPENDQSLPTLLIIKPSHVPAEKKNNAAAPITVRKRLPKIGAISTKQSDNAPLSPTLQGLNLFQDTMEIPAVSPVNKRNAVLLRSQNQFTPAFEQVVQNAVDADQNNTTHPIHALKQHKQNKQVNIQPVRFQLS